LAAILEFTLHKNITYSLTWKLYWSDFGGIFVTVLCNVVTNVGTYPPVFSRRTPPPSLWRSGWYQWRH